MWEFLKRIPVESILRTPIIINPSLIIPAHFAKPSLGRIRNKEMFRQHIHISLPERPCSSTVYTWDLK